ncbi:hypothetical protein ABZY93_09175 [Streptomyces smyrnaeus]|uniref:hypothetical protein n=1 Tax=Streptomyces smyrnaeus TaxID=1387713 RepID=UPI001FD85D27|nr:hypothetical protein [Streptomyces smyrnaeus]
MAIENENGVVRVAGRARRYRGPWLVWVGPRQLHCPLCRGTLFWDREVQLNTAGMSFLNLDWANASATGVQCADCSRLELFADSGQVRFSTPEAQP